MNTKEILNFCFEKGILIDKEVLNLFEETNDIDSVKLILEKIKEHTSKKIITKNVFSENKEKTIQFFSLLPTENQKKLEKLKIKLGLSIEISREEVEQSINQNKQNLDLPLQKDNQGDMSQVKIISQIPYLRKKIEIKDFFRHFKQRFIEMKKILQEHSELDNLISINKISRNNQKVSIIGMVYDKRITKNNNIFLEVEDLTGRIRILINQNKKEVYEKAEDITLDSIIGFKCSGNGEILFANDIIFPDAAILERKKSPVEENVLFISDLHIGGKPFLEENFLKFIDYLNGNVKNTSEVEKIKYLFVVGDLVAGVGNYPNQEKDLVIGDVEEQYSRVAELFNKIRKDIKIIISPGNHDCVRLMEPQPILDEKYAWPLYNLKNVILTSNPSLVNIGAKKDFPGFNILGYHGFSFPYYANNISSLMNQDSINTPYKIMTYLLKNRHLAPTYTSVQNSPSENDELLMKTIPDIFVSSHLHKSSISYYNNILMISNSCWEALTPYQEKLGNIPDFCKVPMFNLKTRQVKILDFYEDENK